MPGEEARVSNVCQCSLSNVAGYVLILGLICWWPKGCKLRMSVQHLSTNKYILLVSCDFNLFTSWHCLLCQCGYLLSTYSCSLPFS